MADKKYRAAVIGMGSISHMHMSGYNQVEAVEVVAGADPHPDAHASYKEKYGIEDSYEDHREMLEAVKPDLVSVCTWHGLHAEFTIAAAEAGVKGIICEKPMCISVGEADRMIAAAEANGSRLVIGHQRRFTSGWERSRQLVTEGAIGEPLLVETRVIEGLLNWGTHTIDGLRYVLGDPEAEWVMGAVERRTDRFERNVPIEDACMGLVQFKDRAQALIESDLTADGSAGEFLIRGSEGMLEVAEQWYRLFNSSSGGWQKEEISQQIPEVKQVEELIEWIEGGPEHRGAAKNGRAAVEIMMALYQSARVNQVVRLPLDETGYPLELMINEGRLPVEVPGAYDIRSFLVKGSEEDTLWAKMRSEGKGLEEFHAELRRRAQGG